MKKNLIVPILTIFIGVSWLLNVLDIISGVDWIWTGCLAAAGILSLVIGGINKASIVTGPFLIIASISSILRQTGKISINHEVPILVIVLGVLMLVSQLSNLPNPHFLEEDD